MPDENAQMKKNLVVEVVAKGGVRCSKISGGDVGLVIPTRRPRTIVRLETTSSKTESLNNIVFCRVETNAGKYSEMPTW